MNVIVLVITFIAAAILFYTTSEGQALDVRHRYPVAPEFNANGINPFLYQGQGQGQGFREHPYAQFAQGPYEYPRFNEMRASYF